MATNNVKHLPEHGPLDKDGREILLSLKNVDITFGKGDNAVRAVKLFKHARIYLENGNNILIDAPENSTENRYIGTMRVNGKSYKHNYLKYDALMNGANIKLHMVSQPEKNRGIRKEDAPYSFSREE